MANYIHRLSLHPWGRVIPYVTKPLPIYVHNPYYLNYRLAAYVRGYDYNNKTANHELIMDMGLHKQVHIPNVNVYTVHNMVPLGQWWTVYPSLHTKKIILDTEYNSYNLYNLPMNKYHVYYASGNKVFYDIHSHTIKRRYYAHTPRTYTNTELDSIISSYIPNRNEIIRDPSNLYYLSSPQRYHYLNYTWKHNIKWANKYFRNMFNRHVCTQLFTYKWHAFWHKFITHTHVYEFHKFLKFHVCNLITYTVDSYLQYKIYNISRANSRNYSMQPYHTRCIYIPITQALNVISTLEMSISRSQIACLRASFLEYYAPYSRARMHGTGITYKLATYTHNKYGVLSVYRLLLRERSLNSNMQPMYYMNFMRKCRKYMLLYNTMPLYGYTKPKILQVCNTYMKYWGKYRKMLRLFSKYMKYCGKNPKILRLYRIYMKYWNKYRTIFHKGKRTNTVLLHRSKHYKIQKMHKIMKFQKIMKLQKMQKIHKIHKYMRRIVRYMLRKLRRKMQRRKQGKYAFIKVKDINSYKEKHAKDQENYENAQ